MDGLTRREFIAATTATTAAVAISSSAQANDRGKLPQRSLGKTGVRVPILGYGTAPTGVRRELKDAISLYNEAIDMGVTYMDTAPDFTGYGAAQVQLGHVLKDRRKDVFLVTKCYEPKGDDALRLLERNLKELQTDHADLVYAHSIGSDKMDLPTVMGKGGVMEMLAKAKREGLTRFVGISGHNRPWKFLEILKTFEIDVMMNAVNFVDRYTYDFEHIVWPVAAQKRVGLVAMKILGGANGDKELSTRMMPPEEVEIAIRYALSQANVSTAVVGIATREELLRNIEIAKNFKPLTVDEMIALDKRGRALAKEWKEHFGPAV